MCVFHRTLAEEKGTLLSSRKKTELDSDICFVTDFTYAAEIAEYLHFKITNVPHLDPEQTMHSMGLFRWLIFDEIIEPKQKAWITKAAAWIGLFLLQLPFPTECCLFYQKLCQHFKTPSE